MTGRQANTSEVQEIIDNYFYQHWGRPAYVCHWPAGNGWQTAEWRATTRSAAIWGNYTIESIMGWAAAVFVDVPDRMVMDGHGGQGSKRGIK